MAIRAPAVIVVALLVVAAGFGYVLYTLYVAGPTTIASENWAGYEDGQSVGAASGTIALPTNSEWHGSGVASLWVGMGGSTSNGNSQWPFWQAGVQVTCSSGACSAELFTEGGTQGPPCHGVCPVDWTQTFGVAPGDSIRISVSGGSTGSVAVLTVDEGGFNTTYRPPPWAVLAGVTSFPSAEWIYEAPTGPSGVDVMPSLSAPGAMFSALGDSTQLSAMGSIQMQGNPNGQSVSVSSYQGTFSAYSYDT